MLDARNITVKLGKSTILEDMNFHAAPGELSVIVGPNGSGKTTLLRAMTGDVPYGGTVELGGQDIKRLKPWQLAEMRAVLPQASVLAFPFTVIEVVQIGLQRGRASDLDTIPMQALARVGLASYANRFYQELSGGEQQRVQLARVLSQVWEPVTDGAPRWLFLDEPVSALDISHQIEVMSIAKDFARKGGGVVAVMHDLNLTAMYADQMSILKSGQTLATGTPKDVMTDDILTTAYGCKVRVGEAPPPGTPFMLPHTAQAG